MSLTAIQNLEAALAAFDKASPAEQRAAADLAKKFAAKIAVQTSGNEKEQYAIVAIAAGRRQLSDLALLRDYAAWSQYESIRTVAEQESDVKSSAFNTNRRLAAPEGIVVR